jgi:hypothetical protein
MVDTYLRAMGCPVFRQRESHPGFRMELENLAGDDKGKGASGSPARPKVPTRRSGADCLVVPMRRSNVRGGKGVGHPRWDHLVNWQQEEPADFDGRRQLSKGGTSRMSREAQVRICERLGAKFPGPTRRLWWRPTRSRNSRPELIADDGQGAFFPACSIPWQRPDRKAGHAPGVKRSDDTSER